MIVEIKEFSSKTGKGTAVDQKGREIEFEYRQLKDEIKIPPGKKAEVVGRTLYPARKSRTFWFYILKLIEYIRSR